MQIVMTIGGINCNAQVLLNELTCRIPKGLDIPSSGLPVKVRDSRSPPRPRQSSLVKTVSSAYCRCL